MNTTPLYIFDLDGTLADLKHRRHFVEHTASLQCSLCQKAGFSLNGRKIKCSEHLTDGWKPNWDAFHAACVDDTPIKPVITLLDELMTDERAEIWVFSGRSDSVEAETRAWLEHWTMLDEWHSNWSLKMRKQGDFTPDDQLKESWLLALPPEDRARLVMVFDDRDRVVNMWRRHGIVCAQVALGNF